MQHDAFIAERTLHALAIDGRGFEIRLGIGKPYQISADEWACSVQGRGLYDHLSDMHGVDSWQALQLACQLAARLLGGFVEDGGRLFWRRAVSNLRSQSSLRRSLPSNNSFELTPVVNATSLGVGCGAAQLNR